MALELRFSIDEDLQNGEKLRFTDTTGDYNSNTNTGGYGGGGNPSRSDIKATRIVSGDVIRRRNAKTGIGSAEKLVLWKEYKHDGTFSYTRVIISIEPLNQFVLPHSDSITSVTNTVDETGRNLVRKDFVPNDSSIDFTPSDLNINEDYFPDRVYDIQYEVYVDLGSSFSDASAGQVVAGNQYIVIPDTSNTTGVLLTLNNGQNLYRYQVFTPDSTQSINPNSATVYELEAQNFSYFNTRYESYGWLLTLASKLSEGCRLEREHKEAIKEFFLDFEGYKNLVTPTCMPDISGAQDMVDRMRQNYIWLSKCLNI